MARDERPGEVLDVDRCVGGGVSVSGIRPGVRRPSARGAHEGDGRRSAAATDVFEAEYLRDGRGRAVRAVGPLRARGKEQNRRRTPVAVSNRAGGGFDWGDAGVGAGAGLGLALVGGACVLVIRRRGRAGLADRQESVAGEQATVPMRVRGDVLALDRRARADVPVPGCGAGVGGWSSGRARCMDDRRPSHAHGGVRRAREPGPHRGCRRLEARRRAVRRTRALGTQCRTRSPQ
jgi:hypothetical protein